MRKLILAVLLVFLMGCESDEPQIKESTLPSDVEITGNYHNLKTEGGYIQSLLVVNFEGHDYIFYSSGRAGGLCHSESCHCKNQ